MKIIFATKNENKLKEIRNILSDTDFEIISLKDANISIDVVEDGETYEANAKKKAIEIMKATNRIVIADDSGLEIDFLDKKPGVYSARFLGEDTPYEIKNNKIIEMMKNVSYEKRTARFVCVIAVAYKDGKVKLIKETIEGIITNEEKGVKGFGYDPIFFVPEHKMTMAEMTMEMKNKISHRGKAMLKIKDELRNAYEDTSC